MKIAISGAGVAGPALAHWLHRSGHEPTLIERAPHFRTGGYVIDFWGVGYRVAQLMGIEAAIREAGRQFVVMDTAPTGHTLLLLDATGAYHRDIVRQMGEKGGKGVHFTTPMTQLQDPRQTKVLISTLAETTPVLEAANLQADLRRAGIEPWAWVINNSLAACAPASPLLRQRARNELREIDAVATRHARRYALVPLLQDEPVGVQRLLALAGHATQKDRDV